MADSRAGRKVKSGQAGKKPTGVRKAKSLKESELHRAIESAAQLLDTILRVDPGTDWIEFNQRVHQWLEDPVVVAARQGTSQ